MLTKEELKNNLTIIREKIKRAVKDSGRNENSVKLIPVSKTFPPELLLNAMEIGEKCFGESYVQELKSKFEWFEENKKAQPEWHFIGHLQRNKVKYIAPFVDTIHAVDSLRLAKEINKRAEQSNRNIKILVQINTSGEDSKFGLPKDDYLPAIKEILELKNIEVIGLMTIAGLDTNIDENIKEFILLKEILNLINNEFNLSLKELSMGMSGDFEEAIKEGSSMVRIGSSIFGQRNYKK